MGGYLFNPKNARKLESSTICWDGHWILDSGASDHISGNKSSFSSFSFPKIPHHVTVANGSKVVSQGSGQVSLSPSLKLNFVLFIPQCLSFSYFAADIWHQNHSEKLLANQRCSCLSWYRWSFEYPDKHVILW